MLLDLPNKLRKINVITNYILILDMIGIPTSCVMSPI